MGKLFSVLHLNICSLPGNYDQLVHYLSSLNHEFSVIVLPETWLTKEAFMSCHHITLPLQSNQVWGRNVSLVHQNFEFDDRLDISLKCDEVEVESVFIEILSYNNKKMWSQVVFTEHLTLILFASIIAPQIVLSLSRKRKCVQFFPYMHCTKYLQKKVQHKFSQ